MTNDNRDLEIKKKTQATLKNMSESFECIGKSLNTATNDLKWFKRLALVCAPALVGLLLTMVVTMYENRVQGVTNAVKIAEHTVKVNEHDVRLNRIGEMVNKTNESVNLLTFQVKQNSKRFEK